MPDVRIVTRSVAVRGQAVVRLGEWEAVEWVEAAECAAAAQGEEAVSLATAAEPVAASTTSP